MSWMRPMLLCHVVASCFCSATGRPASSARHPCHRLVVGLATLAGLLAPFGCHNPSAERQLAARGRSLRWTADTLAYREVLAGKRLQHSAEFIRQDVQHDARQLDHDLRVLQGYLEFDLRRFSERQRVYLEKTGQMLWGKPQNVERAAIVLFL
jgi:hypothetical protein